MDASKAACAQKNKSLQGYARHKPMLKLLQYFGFILCQKFWH